MPPGRYRGVLPLMVVEENLDGPTPVVPGERTAPPVKTGRPPAEAPPERLPPLARPPLLTVRPPPPPAEAAVVTPMPLAAPDCAPGLPGPAASASEANPQEK